jgi:tripartite-type tricarboxylate transporter receptor subunit TctC
MRSIMKNHLKPDAPRATLPRRLLALATTLLLGATASTPAQAQPAYPNKPIHLLVGLAAGGGTDIIARMVSAKLGESLGQQIIVENRTGSGGLIAAEAGAKAAPDGYTLLFGAISYSSIFASLYKKLPYDPVKDFAPISLVATFPNVLVVNPNLPVKSVAELIAYGRANPGKLSYGSSGVGSSLHLSMEMLKSMTKLDAVHVPYKGGAPATADLLGGQIQAMFDNLPGQINYVKAGRTRALAVTTTKRSPQLPDVPTMIEAGVPGYEVNVWYGMLAPAATPKPIIDKLNTELVKTLNSADVKERMAKEGAEPMPTTPAEFAAFQKAEITKWAKVVKESGATAD